MWYFEQDPARLPLLIFLAVWGIAYLLRKRSVMAFFLMWTCTALAVTVAFLFAIALAFLLPHAGEMCTRCVGVL